MQPAGQRLDYQSPCAGQEAQTPRTAPSLFESDDLGHSSCSAARLPPSERQVLLEKLATSLELLHTVKAAAAATNRRSLPLLGRGSSGGGHPQHAQPVGAALSKHNAQLSHPDRVCHTPPSGQCAATVAAPAALPPLQDCAGQQQLLQARAAASMFAEAALAAQLLLAGVLALPPTLQPGLIAPSPQASLSLPAGFPYAAQPPAHVLRFLFSKQEEECLVGMEGQYQQYCNQVITHEINSVSRRLLTKLKQLQEAEQGHGIDKRYFCSLKEAANVIHRAKCLIVAPDVKHNPHASVEPVKMLAEVLRKAQLHHVPVVFSLARRGIGQVWGSNKTISIVAVTRTELCETECATLVLLAQQGCQLYRQMLNTKPFSM